MSKFALALLVLASVACSKKKQDTPATPAPATPAAQGSAAASSPGAATSLPNAVDTPCEQAARDVKGNEGTSWLMKCPAGCTSGHAVWGTDVYTDDSNLCNAAIHAGAIAAKDGGTVLVTWAHGQPTYVGSEKNGVTTQDYGHWERSFYVQKIDATGKPTSPAPTLITAANTAHLSCHMTMDSLPGDAGAKWNVDCPAGCAAGQVWGSDPYTSDSVICSAATHAGVIDAKGGAFVVTIDGKQEAFKGSEKNGVTSSDYGPYEHTFHVAKPQ